MSCGISCRANKRSKLCKHPIFNASLNSSSSTGRFVTVTNPTHPMTHRSKPREIGGIRQVCGPEDVLDDHVIWKTWEGVFRPDQRHRVSRRAIHRAKPREISDI